MCRMADGSTTFWAKVISQRKARRRVAAQVKQHQLAAGRQDAVNFSQGWQGIAPVVQGERADRKIEGRPGFLKRLDIPLAELQARRGQALCGSILVGCPHHFH